MVMSAGSGAGSMNASWPASKSGWASARYPTI